MVLDLQAMGMSGCLYISKVKTRKDKESSGDEENGTIHIGKSIVVGRTT